MRINKAKCLKIRAKLAGINQNILNTLTSLMIKIDNTY